SMAMAEQARLLQKEGPWQGYPQRMLKMRARSWMIRDGFADVLRGLHLREEVEDYAPVIALSQPRQRFENRPIPIVSLRDTPAEVTETGLRADRRAEPPAPLEAGQHYELIDPDGVVSE